MCTLRRRRGGGGIKNGGTHLWWLGGPKHIPRYFLSLSLSQFFLDIYFFIIILGFLSAGPFGWEKASDLGIFLALPLRASYSHFYLLKQKKVFLLEEGTFTLLSCSIHTFFFSFFLNVGYIEDEIVR